MKTIFRILTILLVAALVSAGIFFLVQQTGLATGVEPERGPMPAITDASGQALPPMERPEGGASLSQGLSGVLVTFAKLTVIAIAVLLLQKAFALFRAPRFRPAQNKSQT